MDRNNNIFDKKSSCLTHDKYPNRFHYLISCFWSLVVNLCAEDFFISCDHSPNYTEYPIDSTLSLKSFCTRTLEIDVLMSIEDYVKSPCPNDSNSEKKMQIIENRERFCVSKSNLSKFSKFSESDSSSSKITFSPSFPTAKSHPIKVNTASVRKLDLHATNPSDTEKRLQNIRIAPSKPHSPLVFLSDIQDGFCIKKSAPADCLSPSSVCDSPNSEVEESEKSSDTGVTSDAEDTCASFFSPSCIPEVEDELEELEHGVVSVCGRRRSMEDAVSALTLVVPEPGILSDDSSCDSISDLTFTDSDRVPESILHFYGVYDGHGGPQVSRFCQQNLHNLVEEELVKSSVKSASSVRPIPVQSRIQTALHSAYLKLDDKVCGRCTRPDGCTSGCNHPPITAPAVGSTAVTAVVSESHVVVANCGDSRAVLSRGGAAVELSCDHKPNREDERRRVEAAGGCVVYSHGFRVFGVLAMSRAIGDRFLKPSVIAEPEFTCTKRDEKDECLILASDGLWDVMSSEEACSLARRFLTNENKNQGSGTPAVMAATFLTKLAMARGSSDNISVVVVDLRPKSSL